MPLPPFEYVIAESPQHAAELLAEYGDEAKIIAGGQSLVPLMNTHLARPGVLIDINRVAEMDYIDVSESEIVIGAVTRDSLIERSLAVADACSLLVAATRHIGHPNIRNRGTIGGSLAHNDPAAEYPAVLLALGASVTIRSPLGSRTMSVGDLISDRILETALGDDEILEFIAIPKPGPSVRLGFAEHAPRHGDYAIAGVATVLDVDPDGVVVGAAVGVFGGTRPLRLGEAEEVIVGSSVDSDWTEFESAVRDTFPTTEDVHASSSYRSRVAGVMAKRAVRESLATA
jgi:aerobic carbon-monoxide dehydrogenase medium subunit